MRLRLNKTRWYSGKACPGMTLLFSLQFLFTSSFLLHSCAHVDREKKAIPLGKNESSDRKVKRDENDSFSYIQGQRNKTGDDTKKDLKLPGKLVPGMEIITDSVAFGKTKIKLADGYAYVDNGVVQSIHRPPYKKVYFLSQENQTYLLWNTDEPYPFSGVLGGTLIKHKKLKKIGETKMFGYNCAVYEGFQKSIDSLNRFTFTREIKLPDSLIKGYSSVFYFPEELGAPFKIEARPIRRTTKVWDTILEVISLKKAEIDESLFAVPPYKETKDLTSFTFFTPGSQNIEELFEYHFKKKKQ